MTEVIDDKRRSLFCLTLYKLELKDGVSDFLFIFVCFIRLK